ncbi:hypothetical protein M9458_025175, partial [Cirrhinus mrigala]
SASSSNASLVSKTVDTDLKAQTASKAESIQDHDNHAAAGMSHLQGNNSLSLHAGDGHTSPRRLKEEFRSSEGESKESKPSHIDKFGSGDGRGTTTKEAGAAMAISVPPVETGITEIVKLRDTGTNSHTTRGTRPDDAYRPSGHHNRDGYSSHSHRGEDGGYGRTPLPGHYKRKRSPSADARQSSDECRAKKSKKKKRNKEKH